ncbi:MAG: hypothetical protein OXH47_04220, partial [Paracoccaceae bacterium]|nr:hypothetical protein [Paracoccaceae bacterium]
NSAEIFQYSKNLMKENIPNETPDWVTYVYQNLMASCNVIETAVDTASEVLTDDLTSDELPQE